MLAICRLCGKLARRLVGTIFARARGPRPPTLSASVTLRVFSIRDCGKVEKSREGRDFALLNSLPLRKRELVRRAPRLLRPASKSAPGLLRGCIRGERPPECVVIPHAIRAPLSKWFGSLKRPPHRPPQDSQTSPNHCWASGVDTLRSKAWP